MDFGRQTQRSISTSDAQVHLEPDTAGSLSDARAVDKRFHFRSCTDFAECASGPQMPGCAWTDRKSTRLNSSHGYISYAVFCLKKKKKNRRTQISGYNLTTVHKT